MPGIIQDFSENRQTATGTGFKLRTIQRRKVTILSIGTMIASMACLSTRRSTRRRKTNSKMLPLAFTAALAEQHPGEHISTDFVVLLILA